MNKVHVKTGDTVVVLSGKDKGKKGKVLAVSPKEGKVIVEKINIVSKHIVFAFGILIIKPVGNVVHGIAKQVHDYSTSMAFACSVQASSVSPLKRVAGTPVSAATLSRICRTSSACFS